MIDTIALVLSRDQFRITNPEKFKPNCKDIFQWEAGVFAKQGYVKCIQNMSRVEKQNFVYKPRLTLYRRGMIIELKIEFSIPKLLLGNNFNELQDSDFERVLGILVLKLKDMGVLSNNLALRDAKVSLVHFGKNVVLESGVSSSMVLSEIGGCDLFSRLDVNMADYRNEGHIVKWHANSYEVIFYDKGKDLAQAMKSEKRALENDNYLQMSLLDRIDNLHRKPVVRMEVRLNKPAKIKAVFAKLSVDRDLVFKKIFCSQLAKSVLLYYWAVFEEQLSVLVLNKADLVESLIMLRMHNQQFSQDKLLKLFAVLVLLGEVGLRRLREVLGYTGVNSGKWYRLLKDLKTLKIPGPGAYRASYVIGDALRDFEALNMSKNRLNSY